MKKFDPKKCLTLAALCLLTICLSFATVSAQEIRGTISGVVADSNGAAVPNAAVTATDTATNTTTRTTTGEDGNYTIPFLQPGFYTVTAEAANFKRLVQQNVEIRISDKVRLDLTLEVGDVGATVTVSSDSLPLLNADSPNIGQVIDRRRVSELPLADGNPLALTRLAPGTTVFGDAFENNGPGSNTSPSRFTTNGAPGGNEYTLDGSPNTANRDPAAVQGLRVGLQPPADAVQEFRISTAVFDAQQGHTAGASVDVATRSGANRFFGTLYEFIRNDEIAAANTFFANRSAAFGLDSNGNARKLARRYNRYGGTVGGPVFLPFFGEGGKGFYNGRDRTFFFASYERIPSSQPDTLTFTVPTQAFRNGDFSALLADNIRVYDPATAFLGNSTCGTTGTLNTVCRNPFPNNVIPNNRINPVARQLLQYFPLPNQAGTGNTQTNNFLGQASTINDYYLILGRIDHTINERNKFFVRYSFNDRAETDENYAGFVNGVQPRGRSGTRGNNGATLDYLLTATPTTVVNLRAGYTLYTQDRRASSAETFDPATLGFGGSTLALFGGSRNLPRILTQNFFGLGGPADFDNETDTFSFQPSATKIFGSHTVRFGYDFRVYREDSVPDTTATGQFFFNNFYTGLNQNSAAQFGQDFAAFLLGLPTAGSGSGTSSSFLPIVTNRSNRNVYQGFFVQDDWKLSKRLTLNLGLRYELDSPTTERFNRNTRGFDAESSNPVETQARAAYATAYAANPTAFPVTPENFRVRGGVLFASDANPGFFNADKNNFQPRVGFAYQVDSKTVVRGGFAIYTAPFTLDALNQPGFSQNTVLNVSNNNGLTFVTDLTNPFPGGVVAPSGANLGLATFAGQNLGSNNQPIVFLQRKNAQSARFLASVQRELPGDIVVEAAYIGNRGYDIATTRDINSIPRSFLSTSPLRDATTVTFLNGTVTNPFRNIEAFRGTNLFTSSTVARQQLVRPFPQFGNIIAEFYDGKSTYDSLQLSMEKRFSAGYTVTANYTYSKFKERTTRLNPTDEDYENRLAAADSPHRFNLSAIYELPFGKNRRYFSNAGGLLDALIGGFQIQGFYIFQTATPLTVGNIFYNGDLRDLRLKVSGATIGGVGTSNLLDNVFVADITNSGFFTLPDGTIVPRTDARINLTDNFNIRTIGSRFGNLRGDDVNLLDVSIIKNISFGERIRLQLRAELLNAFNRTLFADPNFDPRNAGFGRSTSNRNLPRELQLGIKFIF